MDQFDGIIDFLTSPAATGIFVALFTMSEALAAIPAIKANGVFQLIAGILARLARKTPAAVALLIFLPLSACTTVHDLGGGRYVVPRTAEVRSPFGTNMGAVMLESCDGKDNAYFPWVTDYRNCQPIKDWAAFSSPGQGGQIAAGALVGLGFGLGTVFTPVGGVSANASQSQSLAVTGASTKGHH